MELNVNNLQGTSSPLAVSAGTKDTQGTQAGASGYTPETDENALVQFDTDAALQELEAIQGEFSKVGASIAGYKNEISSCEEAVNTLKEQVEQVRIEFAQRQQKKNAIYEKLANAQGDERKSIQNELEGVQGECKKLQGSLDTLLTNFYMYDNRLVVAQKNLEAAKASQAELETLYENTKNGYLESFNAPATKNTSAVTAPQTGSTSAQPPTGTQKSDQLGNAAVNAANSLNSTGWCYRGVIRALADIGVTGLTGGSAYMAADQLAARGDFKEITSSVSSGEDLKNLPKGAVVVWSQYEGANSIGIHGHISIALGDGREASDHIQSQITSMGGNSGKYRVFMPT